MVDKELIESVKKHLRITHDYLDEDIRELVEEGQQVINAMCGDCDYFNDGQARRLLKNYCRYAHSDYPEMFEDNFRRDILRLQIANGVKNRAWKN